MPSMQSRAMGGCDLIDFRLSVEALGNTKFVYSPMAEVTSSLRLLGAGTPSFVMRPWFEDVIGLLDDVPMDLLSAIAPPGRYAPDFMFPFSTDPRITIDQQVDDLAAVPSDVIRHDLAECWPGRPLPGLLETLLDSPAPGAVVGEAVRLYWQRAIAPYWSRIRAVLDDDVSYRASRALTAGLLGLFDDLHPDVTVCNEVLRVDKPQHPDATYEGSEIILLPSVFVWPNLLIGHEGPNVFSLTYAARGVGRVWEGLPTAQTSGNDLGALLGRNRAGILRRLEIPMTTTQLARELGQSPGTVNQHLSVLKRNGLLDSWRSGRSVLYRRTALATSIIAASAHLCAADKLEA